LYVFHVEYAIEAFTNESISVFKVSRDGLVFRCLVGLPLDKGSGNAANDNEIENQQFYLKFQKYANLLIIILYCKVDKTRCLRRDITLTDFEDFLLIM
jgi:hypothetical protein